MRAGLPHCWTVPGRGQEQDLPADLHFQFNVQDLPGPNYDDLFGLVPHLPAVFVRTGHHLGHGRLRLFLSERTVQVRRKHQLFEQLSIPHRPYSQQVRGQVPHILSLPYDSIRQFDH